MTSVQIESSRLEKIRRQASAHVEYYFSDQNLARDVYMLEACEGSENVPVRLSQICSFNRMKRYKNRDQIITALRTSQFIELVQFDDSHTDNLAVRRITPVNEAHLDTLRGLVNANNPNPHITPKAKRKPKPVDFLENLPDNPVTPTEFAEDREIYTLDIPFSTRIEIAVQRYTQKRHFPNLASHLFNAWLRYGGWETGPRQFTGKDPRELAGHDPADVALLMATHFVGSDKDDPVEWVVDFPGVVSGFLTSHFETVTPITLQSIQLACRIIRNFLNYLLHRNVCPDYSHQVNTARQICDQACHQYTNLLTLKAGLPGPFNTAVIIALGKNYDSTTAPDEINPYFGYRVPSPTCEWQPEPHPLDTSTAECILLAGLQAVNSTAIQSFLESTPRVEWAKTLASECSIQRYEVTLTVREIHLPSRETILWYEKVNKDIKHSTLNTSPLQPIGSLVCGYWDLPTFECWGLPSPEKREGLWYPGARGILRQSITIYLEQYLLDKCIIGMKFTGNVVHLSMTNGLNVWCLERVNNVYPTFYTLLYNEVHMQEQEFQKCRWGSATSSKQKDVDG